MAEATNGTAWNRWLIGILIAVNVSTWAHLYNAISNIDGRVTTIEASRYTAQDHVRTLTVANERHLEIIKQLREIENRMATKEDLKMLPPEWLVTLARDNAARIRDLEKKR